MTDQNITLIPLRDPSIDWDDLSTIKVLTCKNHTGARYHTKNPWTRTLHFTDFDEAILELPKEERTGPGLLECTCPFSDLRVIKE